MIVAIAAVWFAGALAAIPFVVWWSRDFAEIPRRIWFWAGLDPRLWERGVLIGFVFGGWVAIVVILVWSRSTVRCELREESHELRRRRHLDEI